MLNWAGDAFPGSTPHVDGSKKQLDATADLDVCAGITWEQLLGVYAHLLVWGAFFLLFGGGGVEKVELSLASAAQILWRLAFHTSSFIFNSPILNLHD